MTLLPRFSPIVFGTFLVLHALAVLAVFLANLIWPLQLVFGMALLFSTWHCHQHYSSGGKQRWTRCQLGQSTSILQSAANTFHCKPPRVTYFSEFLIILVFELADQSNWPWNRRFLPLVIAHDSLDSIQQSQLRCFLLFQN